jgi:tetratricopeptide (TPR) repeat protein
MILAAPLCLALAFAPVAPLAAAQPAADAEVERGDAQYAAGHYAEAAAAFAEAHARSGEPSTLYRWAQAERRSGNCAVALQLYERYLRTEDLAPANAEAARKNMARCGHVEAPAEPDVAAAGPPSDDHDDDVPRRGAWLADPLAVSLVSAGGAGVVVSLVLGIQSESRRRRANEAAIEADYVRDAERAQSLRVAAGIVGGISAALVVGGIVRWGLLRRRAQPRVTAGLGTIAVRF